MRPLLTALRPEFVISTHLFSILHFETGSHAFSCWCAASCSKPKCMFSSRQNPPNNIKSLDVAELINYSHKRAILLDCSRESIMSSLKKETCCLKTPFFFLGCFLCVDTLIEPLKKPPLTPAQQQVQRCTAAAGKHSMKRGWKIAAERPPEQFTPRCRPMV